MAYIASTLLLSTFGVSHVDLYLLAEHPIVRSNVAAPQ